MKRQHLARFLIGVQCLAAILSGSPAAVTRSMAEGLGSSTVQLAGLRANVEVRRDDRGIPYLEAANEADLYFAQGYVVASDRLWQMELMRRAGRGELAEVFGRYVLEEDKRHRTFGFAAICEQMVSRLSASARAAFEAYALGVNAFIETLDEKSLPPEFQILRFKPRPWRASDSCIVGKIFSESLSTTWQQDLMRAALSGLSAERKRALLPSVSPLDLIIVGNDGAHRNPAPPSQSSLFRRDAVELPGAGSEIADVTRSSLERLGVYAEELAASNNWVVDGKHSVTGKPLLANDPHLSPSAPSIWYMAHLSAPGLRVAGITVAGLPGIVIGHNERIAWGVTNVEADVQDLYIETADKANPKRYMTPTGWQEANVRIEEIKVRKAPEDDATETVQHEVTVTRHGPIISEKDGIRYALAWPAIDPTTNEIEAYYEINRARNWQEFRAALGGYTGFPLNFVYADVDGHIGYWAAGRYPTRKAAEGTVPHDGATDAGDWTGYIPFDATPHVFDPRSGIIVTANNRVVGLDYPYYLTHDWAAPYRARRIYDLLTAKKSLSVDDFRAIQADRYSFPDAMFAAEVVKLGRPLTSTSAEWGQIVASFQGWDGMMSSESPVAPLASLMREAFQRRILVGVLGADLARRYAWANSGILFDQIVATRPRDWLPKEFASYEELLLACYQDARESLIKRLGADTSQLTWGRLMKVRFGHPLANNPLVGARFAIPPVPQNGSGPTINRGGLVSMRYIADLSNWDNTRQGIALGQSGNPSNPHWSDQLADWQAVTPRIFPFKKEAVVGATRETVLLVGPKVK